jgi:superfamily II RNA helicase
MVKLLRKGVGIHHAGLMPILREMIELLFARGFIKLLFCTETMSVGINLPVKTTIFTDINKFNGEVIRPLYSHEYTQAAGRAGRLGLDTVGHVIHLNNLFRNVESVNYKRMMSGKPQTLTSKFKISYNLLLNLLDIGDNKLVGFANRSMVTGDLANQVKLLECKIGGLTCELDNMKICATNLRTPSHVLSTFIELQQSRETAINKRRKEIERHIQQIRDEYKYVEQDMGSHQRMSVKEAEIADLQSQLRATDSYIRSGVGAVMNLLKDEGLVEGDFDDETTLKLSVRGKLASQLRETHCLIFSKLLEDRILDNLSARQLVSLFSIFTNISVEDDLRDGCPKAADDAVQKMATMLTDLYTEYKDKEHQYRINTGFDYNIQYDLLNYVDEWCGCEEVDSCKFLLQKMGEERHIFLGEFVKALLKINNISCELEKLAELTGNIAFLNKLKEIPAMTLKYVVTNQSLYV